MFLWERISIINSIITNVVVHSKHPARFMINNENPKNVIKICCAFHNKLCKMAYLINIIYSEQLLLTLGRLFIEILNGLHTIVSQKSFMLISYDVFWGSVAAFEMIFVILPTTSTMRIVSIL